MNTSSDIDNALAYICARRRARRSMYQGRKKYKRPNIKSWSDAKCKQMFRFTYTEIHRICEAKHLKKVLNLGNLRVNRELAMAILLFRYFFSQRLEDMVTIFGMSEDNIRRTVNRLSELLLTNFKYDLEFDERQFSKENCECFSKAIFEKGAFYPHIMGFIDETMQQICLPKKS